MVSSYYPFLTLHRIQSWNALMARVFYDEYHHPNYPITDDDVNNFFHVVCEDEERRNIFYLDFLVCIFYDLPHETKFYFRNEILLFIRTVPNECISEFLSLYHNSD